MDSSAGRNASSCSSASVTSAAVANDVSVVMRRRSPSAKASSSGTATERVGLWRQRQQVALELGEQLLQRRVEPRRAVALVLRDVPAPAPGRLRTRETRPSGWRAWRNMLAGGALRGVDAFVEQVERPVGGDEDAVQPRPSPGTGDRPGSCPAPCGPAGAPIERGLGEGRGRSRRRGAVVALPQRELHRLRQPHDHAAPGRERPAR